MFKETIAAIKPLDTEAMERCQLRVDNLTKPLNSLYSFEHIACQLAGVTGNPRPGSLEKAIIIMAADNGVAAETSYEQQVTTAQRVIGFCQGSAAINVFAEHVHARPVLVDIGVASDLPVLSAIRHEKLAYGTNNSSQGPAMTREQAVQAIEVGTRLAREEVAKGVQIIGLGEIGMAGIIPALAVTACYSEQPLAGLSQQEAALIKKILEVNSPDKTHPLDVLTKVGSLAIAGLVGVILGAAAGRAAVVLDGLATSAAALIAINLAPGVKDYLIGSHFAAEPAHQAALNIIGIPAYLKLEINLGEGTGAALGMSLINAALHMLNDMKTFGEAEVAVAQDGPGALKQSKDVRD
ncbi:nicotinate-nucleotide--dimethylbenzimidazole phosphoribosyltransferase [Sporomusa malonica]|uniref:Nicotinate-nucleotide--dimethylbenzimidazole phosphoribosyltransferase n=1 Tax=Sporomusa malonica TaxID=112901 RepID=A0A1W1ZU06_9FIRM|nr:nicotinate-nucleotide--dimethylbenzimidazole phosphoribosyltransferase [Sporomusa malonica]SMC51945.1 nicotinate-nucleotide-dimethylbenzimidazole phosphoribosyltransferase [Sporomusa malonica]